MVTIDAIKRMVIVRDIGSSNFSSFLSSSVLSAAKKNKEFFVCLSEEEECVHG